jgi:hypothetical protein
MHGRTILVVFCMIFLTVSCHTTSVKHDYDLEADFSNLKTYDWMPDPGVVMGLVQEAIEGNTLLDKRIKSAVNDQLAAKGYQQKTDDPDFLVVYYVSVREKLKDWGNEYDGRVRMLQEGTLILDVVDPEKDEVIWRGVASRTLEKNPTPEKREENINNAVKKLLDKFPPPGK